MFTPMTSVPHSLPSQSAAGRVSHYHSTSVVQGATSVTATARFSNSYVEILEQPASVGARFRYKCEGRSAGCIRGASSTDKLKSYPTIQVHGYQGAAGVVVSCVTKDGPPYYPHPHNLVGKTCANGVCYKPINSPDMICNFPNLGIQCVKKKDIKESLTHREKLQVDPFGTGFSHYAEPNKINLNALRLCFQVFIADACGKLNVPLSPVISNPIFDNKTVSDLTITKLSHCSAPVTGGQEIILLCDQVNKDDIQIIFYEENGGKVTWSAQGKFAPHHVHRKAAIWFISPAYKNQNIQQSVECYIQLRRPTDGAVGKPRIFTLLPLKRDPEGMLRKRNKFEALRLDRLLQFDDSPTKNEVESIAGPRVIKQAVRIKTNPQHSPTNCFQTNTTPNGKFSQQSQKALIAFAESAISTNVHELTNQKTNIGSSAATPDPLISNTQTSASTRQKVEDILAIATEQIGNPAAHTFCETPGDDTLEKLSSLDLGFDPCDLDVNLSGITFDSFSETSGLNFSASGMDMKSSEKLNFNDASKQDKES